MTPAERSHAIDYGVAQMAQSAAFVNALSAGGVTGVGTSATVIFVDGRDHSSSSKRKATAGNPTADVSKANSIGCAEMQRISVLGEVQNLTGSVRRADLCISRRQAMALRNNGGQGTAEERRWVKDQPEFRIYGNADSFAKRARGDDSIYRREAADARNKSDLAATAQEIAAQAAITDPDPLVAELLG